MKLIAHRGNIRGPIPHLENNPEYLSLALFMGFDVEVDVWVIGEEFWLGHDKPTFKVNPKLLLNSRFWCHAKNIAALRSLLDLDAHVFWHQNDDRTLTSRGYIWTYPDKEFDKYSIIVQQGRPTKELPQVGGICSDYVDNIKVGY